MASTNAPAGKTDSSTELASIEQEIIDMMSANTNTITANKKKISVLAERVTSALTSLSKRSETDPSFAKDHHSQIDLLSQHCQRAMQLIKKYSRTNKVEKNISQPHIKKLFRNCNRDIVDLALTLELFKFGFSTDSFFMPKDSKYPPRKWLDVIDNVIIRPLRFHYDEDKYLLPANFRWEGGQFQRKHVKVFNSRGLQLYCSHFEPVAAQRPSKVMPCVIYCHGNGGSQCDAWKTAEVMLAVDCTVFAFDFSGCGKSEGGFITLGHTEKDDIAAVVGYLRSLGTVGPIALWGRSMGAASSLMYTALHNTEISALVLDSSFESLSRVICDFGKSKLKLPKPVVKSLQPLMRASIKDRAGFDILDLTPVTYAKTFDNVPIIFGHGETDDFVLPGNATSLKNAYKGKSELILFPGDHNSKRPQSWNNKCQVFLVMTLHEGNSNKYFDTVVPKKDEDVALVAMDQVRTRREARKDRTAKDADEKDGTRKKSVLSLGSRKKDFKEPTGIEQVETTPLSSSNPGKPHLKVTTGSGGKPEVIIEGETFEKDSFQTPTAASSRTLSI